MNSNNITFSFLEKIERVNTDFSIFDNADKILVGLSGGADSVSLVLALKALSSKYGFKLYALHVNHMIRGAEADRDEAFSSSICEKYGIEFFCERIDVPSLCQKDGESLELCARNVRYSMFEKICKEHGISYVATAHNACDNAETVIFNLARGAGVHGLCGIPPKRELCDGVAVIRPLIYAQREEIEAFLKENGENFVTDSTNLVADYTRNYIRLNVIPHLKQINPSLEESLLRTAGLHRSDEEYLSCVAKESVTDNIEKLSNLHESILSRVMIELFKNVSEQTLPEQHVKKMCQAVYSYDGKRNRISLPDSMWAVLHKGRIAFEKDERNLRKEDEFCFEMSDGSMFFEENPYALYISFDQNADIPQTLVKDEIVYKKYTTDYLYFDTIPRELVIRNRRHGDKIKSANMTKSIKRLLTDSLFNERERFFVPFVAKGDKILLVPGVAVCDDCKKNENKNECVSVTLYRK